MELTLASNLVWSVHHLSVQNGNFDARAECRPHREYPAQLPFVWTQAIGARNMTCKHDCGPQIHRNTFDVNYSIHCTI